jgi:hypothetical protein
MAVSFWIFLDQICPKFIKLDQTCFKLDQIGFLTNQKMLLLFLIFWIRSVKLFGQKQVFGSNGFSAETAFRPKILLSNLKWLFGQKWFFGLE